LASVPGVEYLRKFSLKSEGCGIRLSNNLVRDGGFESELWTLENGWSIAKDEANAADGSAKVLKFSGASGAATESWGYSPVTVGEMIYVIARTKNSSGADGRILVAPQFYTSAFALITTYYLIPNLSANYARSIFAVVAPATAAYVRLAIGISSNTTGTHYVDSVAMLKQDVNWAVSAITHYAAPYLSSR